ncbi:MAG: hypothetical protein ILP02_00155 [Clostridia bacterium]|nr:hypothetical protein [Clostridia bacterium]
MFKKLKLKNLIKKCKKQITFLEQKRYRSQAALVAAILSSTTPDETDVEYFNNYTAKINATRDQMHEYQNQLAKL